MAISDDEVEEIIGNEAWEFILKQVRNNKIDDKKMADIARRFGPTVGGNHGRRGGCDDVEMRNVLSDWFEEELYGMDQPAALQRLEEIFSHSSVNMKQTSSKMKELRAASGAGVEVPDSGSNQKLVLQLPIQSVLNNQVETDDGASPVVMMKAFIKGPMGDTEKTGHLPASAVSQKTHYDMRHEKRGKALIFNHKQFDSKLGLGPRNGTDKDAENLKETLSTLGFDVTIYPDMDLDILNRKLEQAAVDQDNSNSDCILVAVLSHGKSGGVIAAHDEDYDEEDLWEPFLRLKGGEPQAWRLAGKPKIFIIQACRGTEKDEGIEMDGPKAPGKGRLPSHADFLIARATVPGHVSFRHNVEGSYFIQELCAVLKSEAYTEDLVSILTKVQGNMAEKSMLNDQFKQIPSFTSQLTKKVQLVKKK
jgi:caspase-like apoptosis-related cysteine protease